MLLLLLVLLEHPRPLMPSLLQYYKALIVQQLLSRQGLDLPSLWAEWEALALLLLVLLVWLQSLHLPLHLLPVKAPQLERHCEKYVAPELRMQLALQLQQASKGALAAAA